MSAELVSVDEMRTEQLPDDWQPPALGSWWWCTREVSEYDRATEEYVERTRTDLVCVMALGSNYAEVQTPHTSHWREHFDTFYDRCTPATNAREFIQNRIDERKENVRELLREIQRVTAQLGIVPRDAIAAQSAQAEASMALARTSGVADVKAHKTALVTAKEKTLPDLFKLVEKEHEQMAVWMKAEMMPAQAEVGRMKESITQIDDRIFTVELYAGLVETVTQIAKGKPAPNDTPIHLFQRRHYMDEECLVNYEAGGMSFGAIGDFDRWLLKPENRSRILPEPRSVVAFRVRRFNRKYDGGDSLSEFIRFLFETDADKQTFLYIRNGEQVFRLMTEIDFGHELFPDVDHDLLFNQESAWIFDPGGLDEPRSQREYEGSWEAYRQARSALATKLWAWKRAGKPKGSWEIDDRCLDHLERFDPYHVGRIRAGLYGRSMHGSPSGGAFGDRVSPPKYEPLTTASVHYDDAMAKIEKAAKDHNRVAVVLQGLLDRSRVFHPHPPWRLWTPEGFTQAIRLVYDVTRALTTGDPPDFEVYRARLNASLKVGSITVGQEDAWERAEAEKYNNSARNYRDRYHRERERHRPYGNPGPGLLAQVKAIGRNGALTYRWMRSKRTENSWRDGEFPTEFRCGADKVLNASAYTRGDFRIFYDDPRTRENYLEWAPFLLAAEDYACGKVKRQGEQIEVDHDENDARAEKSRERAKKARERAAAKAAAERRRALAAEADDEGEDDDDVIDEEEEES